MDTTRNSIRSPQKLDFLPSPTHSRRDAQSRQDPTKLGLEYRQKDSQGCQIDPSLSPSHRPISQSALLLYTLSRFSLHCTTSLLLLRLLI
jgi:hypothetical protein